MTFTETVHEALTADRERAAAHLFHRLQIVLFSDPVEDILQGDVLKGT